MSELWEAFWFFLPAGVANMSPLLAARLPILKLWNTPIDFGKSFRNQRLFGANKTWRGLMFGGLTGAFIGFIQYRFLAYHTDSTLYVLGVPALMGMGALVGDCLESFFKRQAGIEAGERWFPFDQIDYIIGGLLFVWPFVQLTIADVLRIFLIYFGLHLLMSYIGYLIGVKKAPV